MNLKENDINWDNYFIEGTNTLKNKLGIVNREELLEKEIEISAKRLFELYINPINMNFDKEHLKAIHYHLFSDIYPFAGEYRTVYMQKNNSYFASVEDIDRKLDEIFMYMNQDINNIYDKYSFASFLANYYVLLLHVHPFREGNGRAIREFIREYANEKSKYMPFGRVDFLWANVDGEVIESIIDKSMALKSLIELEFLKALVPFEESKGKKL